MRVRRKTRNSQLLLDSGKCDKPMRQSKEAAGWECKGDCTNCFCFIVKTTTGEWEHIAPVIDK